MAVRDEDGVEGQSFGLVDGENAHAFDHGGRDTLLVEFLVPMLQESFEIGHVAVEKLEDGIEEGIEVGRLSGVAFAVFVEGKEDDDLLHEMIEREVALRKAIALTPLLQLLEHVLLLPFRGMAAEVGFGNTVAVEGDVAQGVDDGLHGRRGFEQESFIGNDGDGLKGFAVLKMADDLVDFLLFAHQNGHALEGHTGLVEAQDLAAQFVLGAESVFLLRHLVGLLVLFALFVLLRCCTFDFDAHKAAGIARSLRHFVFGIERADVLPCVHFIGMGLKGLEHSGQFDEEAVVAVDDVAAAAEVAVELFNLCRFAVLQRRQRRPVAATPAVDALLHVAHKHATVALSDVFDKKVAEVGPLQRGGVLELIDHDVAKLHTGPFEDKRGFSARHHLVEENGSVGKHEGVVFVVERVHLFVDFVQQAEGVEVLCAQFARVDDRQRIIGERLESTQAAAHLLGPSHEAVLLLVGLGKEAERVGGAGAEGVGEGEFFAYILKVPLAQLLHFSGHILAVGDVFIAFGLPDEGIDFGRRTLHLGLDGFFLLVEGVAIAFHHLIGQPDALHLAQAVAL